MPYRAVCCHQTTWQRGPSGLQQEAPFSFHYFLPIAVSKGEMKGLTQSSLTKHRISLLDLASPQTLAAVQHLAFSTLEETLAAISPGDSFSSFLFNLQSFFNWSCLQGNQVNTSLWGDISISSVQSGNGISLEWLLPLYASDSWGGSVTFLSSAVGLSSTPWPFLCSLLVFQSHLNSLFSVCRLIHRNTLKPWSGMNLVAPSSSSLLWLMFLSKQLASSCDATGHVPAAVCTGEIKTSSHASISSCKSICGTYSYRYRKIYLEVIMSYRKKKKK